MTARPADQPYSVLASIAAKVVSMSGREAAVARVVLEQPFAAQEWSAQELAVQAGTSAATVIRACHRMGFSGLPELRTALAREIGWTRLAPGVPSRGDADQYEVDNLFVSTARALATFGEHFDAEALSAAVNAVATARRVLFVCVGPTRIVCEYAVFDLLSIGRPAEYIADVAVQKLAASKLGPEDVCFAVGVSGGNEATIGAARAAADAGATVITMTGFARSALAEVGDITLSVSSPDIPSSSHATVCTVAMLLLVRSIASAARRALGDPADEELRQSISEMDQSFHGWRTGSHGERPLNA